MAGFIYIMSNPAFPDLLKIGKSKKDPTTDRVSELNQTGVPEPFKVEYYAFVEDEDYLEQAVHRYFDAQRPNKSREFFTVDCGEAIVIIRQLSEPNSKIKLEEVFYIEPEELERLKREYEEQERKKEERYRAWEEAMQKEGEKQKAERKREANEFYKELRHNRWVTYAFYGVLIGFLVIIIDDTTPISVYWENILWNTYFISMIIWAVRIWVRNKNDEADE